MLIIEDMFDTGLTLSRFKALVEKSEPATLKISVLINRPARLKIAVLINRPDKPKSFTIDWIGLECSDFIIGFSPDYDQFGRNFPAIY